MDKTDGITMDGWTTNNICYKKKITRFAAKFLKNKVKICQKLVIQPLNCQHCVCA